MKTGHAQPASKNKLTSWEWEGLSKGYNVADGHAHQGQSAEYLKIVHKLPALYIEAEKKKQNQIQSEFEKIFFKRAGQHSYTSLQPPLYQYACSLSIEVVANYLRLTRKSVALLHPTFDNLADILKRQGIRMVALDEKAILHPEEKLKRLNTDALFLVCPNNPTGLDITEQEYRAIIDYCKKHKKLLIVDSSFRFYSSLTTWDQYAALKKSGIDFIVLEDTGKTWPTLELKLGITVASDSVYPDLLDITNDFLLNVSPFTFVLLKEYIAVESRNKSYFGAQKIVETNRNVLKKLLTGLPLSMQNPDSKVSVAWIKLPDGQRSSAFCKWLKTYDVHVLPGSPFYWDDAEKGESYFRIALLRPPQIFQKAMKRLRKATKAYQPTVQKRKVSLPQTAQQPLSSM